MDTGFKIKDRKITKIGVVGSGQIGPDIALHFAKELSKYGVQVTVTDVLQAALDGGSARTKKKLDKGVETKAFKPEIAGQIFSSITFTTDKSKLADADLIIEAATERLDIKQGIFADLEKICSADTIFASNSSHMEPEIIFEKLKNQERSLVIHYFFPAERNVLVEIVHSSKTNNSLMELLMKFYEAIGKVPIKVKSRYGFAVDPIFEGIFQAAALCIEQKLANTKQVDAIAMKALGLGVGPFVAMNLTGGNPITQHGLNEMGRKIMPWFRSPRILNETIAKKSAWETAGRGETVEYDEQTYEKVSANLQGAFFGLVCDVLNSGITSIADLEMAIEIGLVMKPPFSAMNKIGIQKAYGLVDEYAKRNPGFNVASVLVKQAKSGKPWKIPYVLRNDANDIAVLTIRRPKVLNALNKEVYLQLKEHFESIKTDSKIKGVVLTGFGKKAFVSGADISMLAGIKNSEDGASMSWSSHEVQNIIENLGKPVIAALNGLAFGGGNELAMACTLRIAKKMPVCCAQPEVKLGIIPGAGATQRLPRLVGIEKATEILRLGKTISSKDALDMGLIYKEVEADIVEEAINVLHELLSGKIKIKPIAKEPISVSSLPTLNIGELSQKIDSILQKAIIDGAKMKLEDGLKYESKLFGECCNTKDMKIGIENFIKTGLKEPAKFVNE